MNVDLFVVARTGSSRLPGKVLRTIGGRPLLEHLICRVGRSSMCRQIVVCTTDRRDDDVVANIAADLGVAIFRGEELDVPKRLSDAAEIFGTDALVLVEADELFADPVHIDLIARCLLAQEGDVVRLRDVPLGAWAFGVTSRALAALRARHDTSDADGWGAWFDDLDGVQVDTIDADLGGRIVPPSLRLTLDYPEDFELVEVLYERLRSTGEGFPSLIEVLDEVTRDPSLLTVNKMRVDEYWLRIGSHHGGLD